MKHLRGLEPLIPCETEARIRGSKNEPSLWRAGSPAWLNVTWTEREGDGGGPDQRGKVGRRQLTQRWEEGRSPSSTYPAIPTHKSDLEAKSELLKANEQPACLKEKEPYL